MSSERVNSTAIWLAVNEQSAPLNRAAKSLSGPQQACSAWFVRLAGVCRAIAGNPRVGLEKNEKKRKTSCNYTARLLDYSEIAPLSPLATSVLVLVLTEGISKPFSTSRYRYKEDFVWSACCEDRGSP